MTTLVEYSSLPIGAVCVGEEGNQSQLQDPWWRGSGSVSWGSVQRQRWPGLVLAGGRVSARKRQHIIVQSQIWVTLGSWLCRFSSCVTLGQKSLLPLSLLSIVSGNLCQVPTLHRVDAQHRAAISFCGHWVLGISPGCPHIRQC